ncbi:non-ribosomal peptide synthetase [Amycolatopsis endophytica]|uniref:Phenyloxazoline synthase MbtB n=1 Tax=Amycolatopsis endophytica TaxID=860233 RepID=A0A853BFL7_9PSEU|nr:non-ribosomal peptide synthetase [Amycolatopsis endophytica]NYI93357.1 amino acid adenylation domain-containing protein [Amycolatopsis endophytica]
MSHDLTDPAALPAVVADLLDLPADEIDPGDDLIGLGLDSITMMRLAGAWRRAGLSIPFAALVAEPTVKAWAALVADATGTRAAPARVPVDETAPFPLALMQHAYWAGREPGQQLGGVAAHFYHEFDGAGTDPARLDRAVRALLARHGMLRVRVSDEGTQRIAADSPWPGLRVHDLRDLGPAEVTAELDRLRRTLSHRRLDISSGEVFDVQLSLLPSGTRMHVNLDMVAADALSLRVLLADLAAFYAGTSEPAPLDYSYPRYLAERAAARPDTGADRAYWQDRLPDLPGAPQLPAAAHATDDATTVVRRHRLLGPDEFAALDRESRRHGLTPAMALAAVFAETLTAWSAEPRFLLNLPLFDREPLHADVAGLVGDFTSSVLLAWDGAAPGSFAERASALQSRFHADVAHAGYSGVEVLRDASRLHGEQVLAPVVYTSALGLGPLFADDVRSCFGEPSWIISQGPQVWLDAQVTELDGGVLVNWDAREDAFAPGVLDAMFAAYSRLLDRLLTEPGAWTVPVPSALPEEQAAVRATANDTGDHPAPETRLHDGFFARAERHPDSPALRWGEDGVMTYGELAGRALTVAGQLRERGVTAGELVAVSLPKGPDQVVAVLGVLAAGAAYLPVGIDQPPSRRERILGSAGVRVALDAGTLTAPATPLTAPVPGSADDLAYVLYTSGSTGEPKGVEITHSAAMSTIADLTGRFGLGESDATLALSALEFDLSVFDLFAPLCRGGAVVCVAEEERRDALAWARLLRRHRATVLNCVPALLDMLLTVLTEPVPLRVVLLGGDWVTVDLPARLAEQAPGCRFVALGGTTETAIHSTVQEVATVDPQWTAVPYGTPLRAVTCRVVDELGRDCPDWVPGELWIGGAGVARGYRGDPGRTADRFVEHEGRRWYRTGDRARYRSGGVIEFLGRTDHQVKIRGHRIELGEVESAVRAHPAVERAVAMLTPDRRLGVVVVAPGVPGDLRGFVAERLPAAMLPERIAALPALPLTANGKVDRRALAASLTAREEAVGTPPRTDVERRVAAVWQDVLGVAGPAREQDFFRLGGDSLLGTRVVARLRADGLDGAALGTLFAHPVLADFAATLHDGVADTARPLVADPARRHEPFPPTDVQQAYWLGRAEGFTLGGIGCHFYREYDVTGLDVARLEEAVNRLVARHEMLRAVFDERGNQRILPEAPRFTIEVTEAAGDPEAAFAAQREALSHQVFDPAGWPLFGISAVRAGDRTRLAIGIDNLVLDALSILVFYTELARLYTDPAAALPSPGPSFRDYVLASGEPREEDRRYWLDVVDTLPPAPQLPLAIDPATVDRPVFTRRTTTLDAARWARITAKARAHGVTPSAVLLTAFAEVLGRWSARADLTLTLTLFDRRDVHPDIERVLGDFTSLLLVGYRPEGGQAWTARVRDVQRELWQALDHRSFSAVRVLRELARRTGEGGASMPVVLTSALGVPGGTDPGHPFTDQVWGVSQTPQVWLDHQVVERAGPDGTGVDLNWDAVEELFPPGVLDAMFDAYLTLTGWLADASWDAPVPAVLPAAQHESRRRVNDTADPQDEVLLHTPVFRQAERRPDATAVIAPDGSALSYADVTGRALRVAGALAGRGVAPGDTVAVCLPKGPDQIVAVLGVLAAGATYVPVGVDQPAPRRQRILATAGVRFVIDDVAALLDSEPLPAPVPADPDALAYVIFTSGSTGEPKGVEITHRAAANTIEDVNRRYGAGPGDRVLAVSALDFDLSVYDVFGLLAAGGAVVTIPEESRRDARRWAELAAEHRVTVWNSVPALLDMLLVVAEGATPVLPADLRLVLLSGDWVGLDLPGRLAAVAPEARLVALGGATEASIWSNAFDVSGLDPSWRSVPYGFPLRNQRYRVVDQLGRDCPDWVPGELWIGGDGVASGYRAAPELTAERFVVHEGTRWYRTGDVGRYHPGGVLEFLGRRDNQVKVRGHRIELGEIEAALVRHPSVTRAVAVVAAGALAAAVVPAGAAVDEAEVLTFAATQLPAHMVPSRLLVLPEIPLSGNGKIDRARITALAVAGSAPGSEPPSGELETGLARLWCSVLEVPSVGRDDGFFTLGGDSVKAIRFIEQAARELRQEIPLADFFAAPTIRELAERLARAGAEVEEGVI